jgi:hypothetical protein
MKTLLIRLLTKKYFFDFYILAIQPRSYYLDFMQIVTTIKSFFN